MAQYDLQLFGEQLIQEDMVEAAIQELDVLFGTEETQLLGDYKYGVNFEQFLWSLQPSVTEVNSYVKQKISEYTYYCKLLKIEVSTNIAMGTIRDIYVVKITLTDSSGNKTRVKNYMLK